MGLAAGGLGRSSYGERLRGDFPILERTVHGQSLAYLDNAATSQKPDSVIEAMSRFYSASNANIHRSVHTLGEEATAAYEEARGKVRRFIGARKDSEIVFTRGTTESINLVASSWGGSRLRGGDAILLTEMEHHSDIVPWQLLAARVGCRVLVSKIERDGSLDLSRIEAEWDSRTRLVAVAQASNVLGTVNDVKALAALAHRRGALILVDAAQSVPHFRVDVGDLDCDFLAFSGHKAYGPMGIGVLYGREPLLEEMPPWMGGGDMIRSVSFELSTWNDLPWKFEAGTPNVAGAIGLGSALDYLEALGWDALVSRESALSAHALDRLSAVEGLVLYGSSPRRCPVFSFNLGSVHAHDVAQYLDRQGIAVRAGHHCAQPLMRALAIPAAVRASLAFYNTEAEIDRLAAALVGAARFYA
jgi:cysteine desulfurase/selenocysteine lyase